jgi:hypothetical protein
MPLFFNNTADSLLAVKHISDGLPTFLMAFRLIREVVGESLTTGQRIVAACPIANGRQNAKIKRICEIS